MSFEATFLPDSEKERLCRELLAEFGVTSVKPSGDGELIHNCCLPFGGHSDGNSQSASLNWKKLTYNCFVCGNSGGLLWFIGACRGTNGTQSRQWLDDQTGAGPDEQSLSALLQFFDALYGQDRYKLPPLPRMDERVLSPWMKIHPYMTEDRGIPEENLVQFKVGYGVIPVNLGTREAPNWVDSHRIVLPHFWRGNLVGWQSRRLVKDGTAKYLSTPDFPKDQTIFNYDPKVRPVVVESPMSVIAKAHCEHFEATFGAKLTDRQIKLLASHEKVVLWFDNDEAGWHATQHVGTALVDYTDVWVVSHDIAADAADFTDVEVLHMVDSAVPFSLWSPPKTLRTYDEVYA